MQEFGDAQLHGAFGDRVCRVRVTDACEGVLMGRGLFMGSASCKGFRASGLGFREDRLNCTVFSILSTH